MKKIVFIVLVMAMLTGLAAVANASTDWSVYLRATDQNGANSLATTNNYGVKSGAVDGISIEDASNAAGTGNAVALGCFDKGSGNFGNGYYKDIRSNTGTDTFWTLKLWGQPSCAATSYKLTGSASIPSGLAVRIIVVGDPAKDYTFESGSSGFTWTFSPGQEYTLNLYALPEPGSMAAMLSGLVGLVGFGIYRRK